VYKYLSDMEYTSGRILIIPLSDSEGGVAIDMGGRGGRGEGGGQLYEKERRVGVSKGGGWRVQKER
jgi:hypothetical protein